VTTKTGWLQGPADEFWMEDNPPSGTYNNWLFDSIDIDEHTYKLFIFLSNLKIIEHGCIYETAESIRIKVRNG
jgi:hypothetical protein